MNEVSTKLTKINFKWLIKHCTDKENWKRSWTVFDYDNFKCVMTLDSIAVKNNELILKIEGNNFWNVGYICLPMDENNFNEKVFTKKIYNVLFLRISNYELDKISETEMYKEAQKKDDDSSENFRQRLNDYLDDLQISDEEIRKSYIDLKIGEFDSEKYIKEVASNLERKVLCNHYAMLALQFDVQKDYQEIMKQSDVDEESLKERFAEIEYEYQDDMDCLLES